MPFLSCCSRLLAVAKVCACDPNDPGTWLRTDAGSVALALNLVPFAGVAFLWFVGVLRDRLGDGESLLLHGFFGSALLFLAMLFASAAVLGAIVLTFANESGQTGNSATFHFARVVAYNMANVYALKMAAVFMISTSTVAVQSGFMPRWMAFLGFAFGLTLLIGSYFISWSSIVLPIWVFLVSSYILLDNFSSAR